MIKNPISKKNQLTLAAAAEAAPKPAQGPYINIMTSRYTPSGVPSGDEAYFNQLGAAPPA